MSAIHKILSQQQQQHQARRSTPSVVIIAETRQDTCPAPSRGHVHVHHPTTPSAKSVEDSRHHMTQRDDVTHSMSAQPTSSRSMPTLAGETHHHGHLHSHKGATEMDYASFVAAQKLLKTRLTDSYSMILEVAGALPILDEALVKSYLDVLLTDLGASDEASYHAVRQTDIRHDRPAVETSAIASTSDQAAVAFVFIMALELMVPTEPGTRQLRSFAEALAQVHHSNHRESSTHSGHHPALERRYDPLQPDRSVPKVKAL